MNDVLLSPAHLFLIAVLAVVAIAAIAALEERRLLVKQGRARTLKLSPRPFSDASKPSRAGGRMFILLRDDEDKYFAAARLRSPALYDLGRLILNLGCRPGELLALEWENVDLLAGTIRVVREATKTDAGTRTLTLTPEARSILAARLQAKQGQYVFPGRFGRGHQKGTQRTHDDVLRIAKCRPFVVYDLRHTFASRMANGGPENDWQPYCPLPVLMRILGHRKIETTMRYVKTTPEAAARAMERYGEAICSGFTTTNTTEKRPHGSVNSGGATASTEER